MTCARAFRAVTAIIVLIVGLNKPLYGQVVFGDRGFEPKRDYFSQLPFEHIDPLTGNLLLTFTDLVLPGNAGFDLRIQRTYNSKIYRDYQNLGDTLEEDSWAGIGWTMHMGRVFHARATDGADPVIEMPDGSRRHAFPHMSPPPGCGQCFVTRDFWIYDKATMTLSLPNGVSYTFGHTANIGSFFDVPAEYTTQIRDPFGNTIVVEYFTSPADGISRITQNLGGGQTRQVTFTVSGAFAGLATMVYSGRTWTYNQTSATVLANSLLNSVTPPVGPGWTYGYQTAAPPRNELTSLTTPNGGTITYQYQDQLFNLGSSVPLRSRVVILRTTGGRLVLQGVWTYAYAQGAAKNQSVITGPCSVTTYDFLGVGNFSTPGNTWSVGLPSKRTVTMGPTTYETQQFFWIPSVAISFNEEFLGLNHDVDIFVPLLDHKTITRGTATETTQQLYHTPSFNDYGRPYQTTETGIASGGRTDTRTTSRVFQYGFSPYIVDRLQSSTVTVGAESFTTSRTYNVGTGFTMSENRYGVTTTFQPTPTGTGNVASKTDALGHTTSYGYSWGETSSIQTPGYLISRVINPDGTVASETRRGFTTTFDYDALMRPTFTTPAIGNRKKIIYDNGAAATFTRLERDNSSAFLRSDLDGFGRVNGTQNAAGVRTSRVYDACGNVSFESYPFVGTTATGTTLHYDPLGRVFERINPDQSASRTTFVYDGLDVTMTDEEQRVTTQEFSAFGDPGEVRLTAIVKRVDNINKRTTYTYSALGSLESVTPQFATAAARQWVYNTKHQLESERHPENGTITYTYYPNGNLFTRTDARNQITFGYDTNDRVTSVTYGSSPADNVLYGYDDSDNRTSMSNHDVSTVFGFDGANRLRSRQDVVNSHTLTTTYTPDDNDNLIKIEYASGRVVKYTYDNANRIATVTDGANQPYATEMSYHPSGRIAGFKSGNNLQQVFGFDSRYRPATIASGPLALTYGYDKVGNIKTIDDTRGPAFNQSFDFDDLDRLIASNQFGFATYLYDDLGNRRRKTTTMGSVTYNYDDVATQQLSSSSGYETATYHYDGNGNTTSDDVGTYTYSPDDMLRTATIAGHVSAYAYDPDKLRITKTVDGTTTYYVHGASEQLLGEFDASASKPFGWLRDYVYAGDRLIAGVSCQFAVTPSSTTVQSAGGNGSITLGAGTNCAWTASSDVAWATISSATSGVGAGTVFYAIAANSGGLARAATLTIAGKVFSIVQSGSACTVALSPSSASYAAVGGPGSVSVTAPAGCAWSAQSNAQWITIGLGGSGSGNGSAGYTVAPNGGSAARSGSLTINGQAFSVSQAGQTCSFGISPTSRTIDSTGNSGSFSVSASLADCAWVATSNAAWITITGGASGTGAGTVSYAAAANPTASQRTGTLTAAGKTFTITQSGAPSLPVMYVDVPVNNATVGPPFLLGGWAIDRVSPTDTGVNAIHVYAYPLPSGPPVWIGAATYGLARPDVGAAYGAQFTNSGFQIIVGALPPGSYTFAANAYSTVANGFNNAFTVTVTIPAPVPYGSVDSPTLPSVQQPFAFTGWAIDTSASMGSGIDLLDIYALPAAGGPAIYLGQTTCIPNSRPDIGGVFGDPRFSSSGWGVTVSGLTPGNYTMVAYAHSTVSGTFVAAYSVYVSVQ